MAITNSRYVTQVGTLDDETLMMSVAANKKIFNHALVVKNTDGTCESATTATGKLAIGFCVKEVDNTGGASGDKVVRIRTGVSMMMMNSAAADEITSADIGKVVFIVDDNTVAKTNGSNTRSAAGVVSRVADDGKVLVAVDYRLRTGG